MNKLIKHEFRATARLMLPLLALCVVSSLLFSVLNRSDNISGSMEFLLGTVITLAFLAVGIMGLVIIIGRFYCNTMTGTGYLTMTLPLNSHEFIMGELIVCLVWFLIAAIILFADFLASITILDILSWSTDFYNPSDAIKAFSNALKEHGVNGFTVFLIILECIVAFILGFFEFCLRFYSAMSVGQVFSKHKILLTIIAYFIIGSIVSVIFWNIVNTGIFSADTPEKIVGILGIFDLTLLIIDSLMYFPTALLIGKKLNLP